jgi:hypothetical protein
MALVYRHLKPCGEVFYIGIGVSKKRAYSKHGRNKHWINTVNKYGYEVQILTNNIDYEFAKEIEVNLISYYGRKDLNFGKLVNMTDGGEGYSNMNDEEKLKRKVRLTDYNKNTKDYSFTQNKDYKLNMRNSCLGKNNKKIIDIETGIIFESMRKASEFSKVNYTMLSGMLNNKKINKTNLQWLN